MLNISEETIAITKRFFLVINTLIEQKKIRGLNSFAKKYNLNYWNLCTLKKEPEKRILKVEFIAYLVRDFNVSPMYLLLGVGEVFNKETHTL